MKNFSKFVLAFAATFFLHTEGVFSQGNCGNQFGIATFCDFNSTSPCSNPCGEASDMLWLCIVDDENQRLYDIDRGQESTIKWYMDGVELGEGVCIAITYPPVTDVEIEARVQIFTLEGDFEVPCHARYNLTLNSCEDDRCQEDYRIKPVTQQFPTVVYDPCSEEYIGPLEFCFLDEQDQLVLAPLDELQITWTLDGSFWATGVCVNADFDPNVNTTLEATATFLDEEGNIVCTIIRTFITGCSDEPECSAEFTVTSTPDCPSPMQFCDICQDGGQICVTYAGGQVINGTVAFITDQGNTIFTNSNGCANVNSSIAKSIAVAKITESNGCEYTIPAKIDCFGLKAGQQILDKQRTNAIVEIHLQLPSSILTVENKQEQRLQVELININGQVLFNALVSAYESTEFRVADLSSGMYIARITIAESGMILNTQKVLIH